MTAPSVAVVVVDHTDMHPWDMYEVAIASAVFGVAQPDLADPWYDLRLCPGSDQTSEPRNGVSLTSSHRLSEILEADLAIVTAVPEACVTGAQDFDDKLLDTLRRAAAAGVRLMSLCTGAFALAEAGLLNGRRATAHWAHTAILADRFPQVTVDDAVLYVDDGPVLTSAGMTAGLDLCLHVVRTDFGAHVANQLARRLVVPAHRPGGQAQFIDRAVPARDHDGIGGVLQWATAHLDRPHTVEGLARRARLSPRTFFRRVQAATGTTPLQWLLHQRLAHAQVLLETTGLPIDAISERCGLGSAANLRRHFSIHVGVPPQQYRRAFAPLLSNPEHATGQHSTMARTSPATAPPSDHRKRGSAPFTVVSAAERGTVE
ncbi:helix-turn-helix domain-containing protein [Actinoplanes hulinensis]|uniref:Helix-turn-helix domain-containing protein n=1 Tax=Actinoplanes hulinensis TaxID=1144547 RepID=A0ABS7AX79_9ACTN|nr:helix-turn-helix domain-containing protein [Actinoplanes hulinensis]MBW6433381.1 helix-turn-helix domain-containing protein [Actinoplanes hulinensis]